MSLVIETIKKFGGFGQGDRPDEYYYSQGMNKSRFGVPPNWKVQASASDVSGGGLTHLSTLERIRFFTQGQMDGTTYLNTDTFVVGTDINGRLYRSQNGTGAWELFYQPPASFNWRGNGLIFDQNQKLLYAGARYLGYIDPLNGAITAGTIAVTSGSPNVVGTGTTFTSGMVGKRIQIGTVFYDVLTFTDATHIVLTTNYAGATASGLSFRTFINYFDQWKDFGTDFETFYGADAPRASDTYEDWVLFANGNHVAVLNAQDSSWNAEGFSFPNFFEVSAIASGRTGVLLGANFNNKGVLALWDAQSERSLAPWIWTNNIRCIKAFGTGWLVFTTTGIYVTNGYTIEPFIPRYLDTPINVAGLTADLGAQGAEILGNLVAFWGKGQFNRSKDGIYVLNLVTGLMEFTPVHSGATYGITPGAIFFDSLYKTHVSYSTDVPDKQIIGSLANDTPAQSHVVFEVGAASESEKVAQAVKLHLTHETRNMQAGALNFTVAVKIYNFRRLLWNRSQTNAASTVADQLRVDGTVFQTPVIGDEVTVLHGINAGQVRHITSISAPGTAAETWTLDSALSDLSEASIQLSVMPFELVSQKTIQNTAEINDLFFDVKNRMKGKRYLIKVLLEGVDTLTPELQGAQFVYDDRGPLTSH